MTLDALNHMDRAGFVAALGSIFEHSPWVAEDVADARPFASVDALHAAMAAAVAAAPAEKQIALMRAHPRLAANAGGRAALTAASTREQADAGLDACSADEQARLAELNARYDARFGFPFILAVKGYAPSGIIAALEARLARSAADEHAENLRQIARIARLRLAALMRD